MANLKDLRNRISSVKSTQKITSAMKMVAASKLRRAQDAAERARPYSERMERMVGELVGSMGERGSGPKLLTGTGEDKTHLFLVITADRGLCGALNTNVVREVRRRVMSLKNEGKEVKILCLGRKGRDGLKRDFPQDIVDMIEGIGGRRGVEFEEADDIAQRVVQMYEEGEFDVCTVVYNKFVSVISQKVTPQQLIPFTPPEKDEDEKEDKEEERQTAQERGGAQYEFEPSDTEILERLLPANIAVQIFRGLLENAASEHGARMTAMDNATRNADEMIDDLSLEYNRTRQAAITTELMEIISGAEAL